LKARANLLVEQPAQDADYLNSFVFAAHAKSGIYIPPYRRPPGPHGVAYEVAGLGEPSKSP
jgi:hypothetical protein